MNGDASPASRAAGGNSWHRRRIALALLLVAAIVTAGCGGDDASDDEPRPQAAAAAGAATGGDFDTLDADGDSYLDRDEIAENVDSQGVFEAWDADADAELDRDEIAGNAFRLWDRDADERVSEREWAAGTEWWYPPDAELVVFDDLDADGDSELDRDEISERFDLSALGETWNPGPLDRRAFERAYVSLYDTDDDGRISRKEWSRSVTARSPA